MRMAMMAITTSNSISVNADRRTGRERDMDLPPGMRDDRTDECCPVADRERIHNRVRADHVVLGRPGGNGRRMGTGEKTPSSRPPADTARSTSGSGRTRPKRGDGKRAYRALPEVAAGRYELGRAATDRGRVVTSQDVQLRKAEFARYLADHQARLYGYIHSLVPDLNHADDLYQQTALVLWNKFDEFDRGPELLRLGVRGGPAGGGQLRPRPGPPAALLRQRPEPAAGRGPRGDGRRRAGRPPGALSRCVEKLPPGRPRAADRVLRGRRPGSTPRPPAGTGPRTASTTRSGGSARPCSTASSRTLARGRPAREESDDRRRPTGRPLAGPDRGLPERAARRARLADWRPACGPTPTPGGRSSATPGCTPTCTSNSAPGRPASGSSTRSTGRPPGRRRRPASPVAGPPAAVCWPRPRAAARRRARVAGWSGPRRRRRGRRLAGQRPELHLGRTASRRATCGPGRRSRIDRGLAEVRFRCGARVVLEGPARLELLSGRAARLHHGKLTARVPPEATGFEVLRPQGKVIDLGTEFGVVGRPTAGATDVYVFEGRSRPTRPGPAAGGSSLTQRPGGPDRRRAGHRPAGRPGRRRFVRAIVPPPVVVAARAAAGLRPARSAGTLRDAAGAGTGLTHRLPGTGDGAARQRREPAARSRTGASSS